MLCGSYPLNSKPVAFSPKLSAGVVFSEYPFYFLFIASTARAGL